MATYATRRARTPRSPKKAYEGEPSVWRMSHPLQRAAADREDVEAREIGAFEAMETADMVARYGGLMLSVDVSAISNPSAAHAGVDKVSSVEGGIVGGRTHEVPQRRALGGGSGSVAKRVISNPLLAPLPPHREPSVSPPSQSSSHESGGGGALEGTQRPASRVGAEAPAGPSSVHVLSAQPPSPVLSANASIVEPAVAPMPLREWASARSLPLSSSLANGQKGTLAATSSEKTTQAANAQSLPPSALAADEYLDPLALEVSSATNTCATDTTATTVHGGALSSRTRSQQRIGSHGHGPTSVSDHQYPPSPSGHSTRRMARAAVIKEMLAAMGRRDGEVAAGSQTAPVHTIDLSHVASAAPIDAANAAHRQVSSQQLSQHTASQQPRPQDRNASHLSGAYECPPATATVRRASPRQAPVGHSEDRGGSSRRHSLSSGKPLRGGSAAAKATPPPVPSVVVRPDGSAYVAALDACSRDLVQIKVHERLIKEREAALARQTRRAVLDTYTRVCRADGRAMRERRQRLSRAGSRSGSAQQTPFSAFGQAPSDAHLREAAAQKALDALTRRRRRDWSSGSEGSGGFPSQLQRCPASLDTSVDVGVQCGPPPLPPAPLARPMSGRSSPAQHGLSSTSDTSAVAADVPRRAKVAANSAESAGEAELEIRTDEETDAAPPPPPPTTFNHYVVAINDPSAFVYNPPRHHRRTQTPPDVARRARTPSPPLHTLHSARGGGNTAAPRTTAALPPLSPQLVHDEPQTPAPEGTTVPKGADVIGRSEQSKFDAAITASGGHSADRFVVGGSLWSVSLRAPKPFSLTSANARGPNRRVSPLSQGLNVSTPADEGRDDGTCSPLPHSHPPRFVTGGHYRLQSPNVRAVRSRSSSPLGHGPEGRMHFLGAPAHLPLSADFGLRQPRTAPYLRHAALDTKGLAAFVVPDADLADRLRVRTLRAAFAVMRRHAQRRLLEGHIAEGRLRAAFGRWRERAAVSYEGNVVALQHYRRCLLRNALGKMKALSFGRAATEFNRRRSLRQCLTLWRGKCSVAVCENQYGVGARLKTLSEVFVVWRLRVEQRQSARAMLLGRYFGRWRRRFHVCLFAHKLESAVVATRMTEERPSVLRRCFGAWRHALQEHTIAAERDVAFLGRRHEAERREGTRRKLWRRWRARLAQRQYDRIGDAHREFTLRQAAWFAWRAAFESRGVRRAVGQLRVRAWPQVGNSESENTGGRRRSVSPTLAAMRSVSPPPASRTPPVTQPPAVRGRSFSPPCEPFAGANRNTLAEVIEALRSPPPLAPRHRSHLPAGGFADATELLLARRSPSPTATVAKAAPSPPLPSAIAEVAAIARAKSFK